MDSSHKTGYIWVFAFDMENESPIHNCRNCGFPLPEGAHFCPACSQRNHDGRLTLREFLSEMMSSLLNLDNRIFRTMGALAIPGKLTENYFEGKHIRFYHPVRLFLLSGALFIAMLSLKTGDGPSNFFPVSYKQQQALHQKHQLYLQLDSLKKNMLPTLNNRAAIAALDTLLGKLDSSYITSEHDSIEFALSFVRNAGKDTIYHDGGINISLQDAKKVNISVDDLENMSEDSLLNAYGIYSFWQKLLVRQQIKLLKKGDNFVLYILGNTLWMMLIMMPMLALVLKLLYLRRKYYFLEHLIFSFHVHSFIFLLLTIVTLASEWANDLPGLLVGLICFTLAIYPMLAMKRFYRQGWLKTLVKYLLSSMLYLMIFIFAIIGLALLSFALF